MMKVADGGQSKKVEVAAREVAKQRDGVQVGGTTQMFRNREWEIRFHKQGYGKPLTVPLSHVQVADSTPEELVALMGSLLDAAIGESTESS